MSAMDFSASSDEIEKIPGLGASRFWASLIFGGFWTILPSKGGTSRPLGRNQTNNELITKCNQPVYSKILLKKQETQIQ
jgi:hypothetical protein